LTRRKWRNCWNIQIYATSVESNDEKDKTSSKAIELYNYLNNNKEGLLPYQDREKEIPEAPEHLVYKAMGVQENQNCTTITLRMKHRRMRWSPQGANNMAKAPKKDGKGNSYADRFNHHMLLFGAMQTASRKAFKRAFGY